MVRVSKVPTLSRHSLLYCFSIALGLILTCFVNRFVCFFKIGINSMQSWTDTARHEVTKKKKHKKIEVLHYLQSETIWAAVLENYSFAKNYHLHRIAGRANICKYIIYIFSQFWPWFFRFLFYVTLESSSLW